MKNPASSPRKAWYHRFWDWLQEDPEPVAPPNAKLLAGTARAQPCRLRRMRPEDLPHLYEIHELLAGNQVPSGYQQEFKESLEDPKNLTLVAEAPEGGRPVACGLLRYMPEGGWATLSFGLVHPDFQRRGIGHALLYARFGLLWDQMLDDTTVQLTATEYSSPWFAQLGIRWLERNFDALGHRMSTGYWKLSALEVYRIRYQLPWLWEGELGNLDVPVLTLDDFAEEKALMEQHFRDLDA